MSTQLFCRWASGNGNIFPWLQTTRGAASWSGTKLTVAGPASVQLYDPSGSPYFNEYVSDAVQADFTLSGTITLNVWMYESSMSANCGAKVVIDLLAWDGTFISNILTSAKGTEMGYASPGTAQNWTATPTSTNVKKGDRIRVKWYFSDAGGTMASGYSVYYYINGAVGTSGDTYVTFTETFSVTTLPDPTTKFWLRDDAADADLTANVDKALVKTQGSAVVSKVTDTVAGPVDGVPLTDTQGGTAIVWWSKQVKAATLPIGSYVCWYLRMTASYALAYAYPRIKIERTDGSGTVQQTISDVPPKQPWYLNETGIAGYSPDHTGMLYPIGLLPEWRRYDYRLLSTINFADGNRIKVTVMADDVAGMNMAAGYTFTVRYGYNDANTADAYVGLNVAIDDTYTPPVTKRSQVVMIV